MQDRHSKGFVKIARCLFDSELMQRPPLQFKLWIWMISRAGYRDTEDLQRGQFRTTIREMREAMGHRAGFCWKLPTIDKIRWAYRAFVDDEMITIRKASSGMVITILNYDKYQSSSIINPTRHTTPHTTPHTTWHTAPENLPSVENDKQNKASKIHAHHTAHHTAPHTAHHLAPPHAGAIPCSKKNNNPPYSPPLRGDGKIKTKIKLPGWLDSELWQAFKEHRQRLRKPMTLKAEQLNLAKLKKLKKQGNDPAAVINQSIERGWQGLFALKDKPKDGGPYLPVIEYDDPDIYANP